MKKINLLVVLALITNVILAQVPNLINYQTVIRDNSGDIVANQAVDFEISIITGSISGTPIYTEAHTVTTNGFGIVNFLIGGGTPSLGTFNTIDWSVSSHYVNTKVDVGSGLEDMGTQQLMSVPYALLSENVVNDSVIDNDADPANEIQSLSIDGDTIEISNGNSIVLPVANNGGKTYFTISGAITNAEAATKIAQGVGPNTQIVLIQNTTGLTSVDLSALTEMISIKITGNADLASVNFSGVTEIFEDLVIADNALLTVIDFSALQSVNYVNDGLSISNNAALIAISFPSLIQAPFYVNSNSVLQSIDLPSFTNAKGLGIGDNLNLTAFNCNNLYEINGYFSIYNTAILSLSFPSLIQVNADISIAFNSQLQTLSLPNTQYLWDIFTVSNNDVLVSIDISSVASFNSTGNKRIRIENNLALTSFSSSVTADLSIEIRQNASLSNLSLPNVNIQGSFPKFDIRSNALPSAIINTFLAKLVSATTPYSGEQFIMYNQTPPAPPTGQGITDKATLIANGNTVNTD